jgi:hypothetical protein
MRVPSSKLRAAFAATLIIGCGIGPAACASGYATGIPADPAVRSLTLRAQAGDKFAQLELGIRYEEGRGVAADPEKARKLYSRAAADSGGTLFVYSPAVGKVPGRVIPLTRPRVPGLPAARLRLQRLAGDR